MSGNKEQPSNNIRRWVFTIFIIAALYLLLIFAINIYVEYDEILFSLDKTELQPHELAGVLGTKGDYFGGLLNPMFAFFSLIALLATIRIQLSELAMMREELTKTTEANEKQAEALEEQVNAARQQQFDNTFATLLSEHNKILSEIADNGEAQDVLEFKTCKSAMDARRTILGNNNLCKYYRVLYQLLKFIARNHPDNKKRDFSLKYLGSKPTEHEKAYSSLVRAMIPSNLILGLANNCAFGRTKNKDYLEYTLLVERYSMFEHLNMDGLLAYNGIQVRSYKFDFICLYKRQAFDKNTSLSQTFSKIRKISKMGSADVINPFDYEATLDEYGADSIVAELLLSSELIEFKERKDAEMEEEF
ncbi:putative phage abortive infection protein [Vibrio parahaemolyticus]|uniref:putative phage abortive infection protein n=1 Tax=Vibrio parahaemolyticus TaxID=670 RepID=UPI001F19D3C2|nr:putative phage abortive infection protein [Vibrio parahaemolyticus]MCG0008955.1 putative phage abortive infection protein [Vibrio parahaemolyticus]MDL2021400.1 putative phage abortive infection protein [Vibrio parahaemolyticus]MDL2025797.1 putative phage abortive infection protein [Vibrio parahaemolyticus]